jgi:hypothetical protein
MNISARLEALRAGSAPADKIDDDKLTDATMPGDDDDDDDDLKKKPASNKKDKPMAEDTPVEQTAEYQKGVADTMARFSTVTASANYAGRESLALNLLGNAAMSAEAIVAALGTVAPPVAAAPAAPSEPDDANDRADLRAQLAANQPATLGQDAESQPKADADAKAESVNEILAAQRSFGARAPRERK